MLIFDPELPVFLEKGNKDTLHHFGSQYLSADHGNLSRSIAERFPTEIGHRGPRARVWIHREQIGTNFYLTVSDQVITLVIV